MSFQLLTDDCLYEIFKYLEKDKFTLYTCLFVNRRWCETSVQLLWRNVFNYNTLIKCLPDDSKEILFKNEIILPSLNSNPPLFNYVSFVKSLSINEISRTIEVILHDHNVIQNYKIIKNRLLSKNLSNTDRVQLIKDYQIIKRRLVKYIQIVKNDPYLKDHQLVKNFHHAFPLISESPKNNRPITSKYLITVVTQEVFKMFMNQISLRELNYYSSSSLTYYVPNITFTVYPGATDCFKNLTELRCCSDVHSEFFFQLSQFCHKIRFLEIRLRRVISTGVTNLISAQNHLMCLRLWQNNKGLKEILPSLTKHLNSISRIDINVEDNKSLLFLTNFTNLRELVFFEFYDIHESFQEFQHVKIPKLRTLKFQYKFPKSVYLDRFLENNGNHLIDISLEYSNNSINSSVAKYCPNLKSFSTIIVDDEFDILKLIFDRCEKLESIKFVCEYGWYKKFHLENELFDIIARFSPKNFQKLKIRYIGNALNVRSELSPEEMNLFFINWNNRTPRRSLSLTMEEFSFKINEEIIEIINNYVKLGVVKEFTLNNM
ncbi:11154_t:CDS:1 [Funneliformis mosseae]|uniref:11154_t:CDS:1 n=1 Tax=Funneliformis mosseae TaxID=27381 RepID=A0A9N8VZI9_FUNMO|nr:11154_t:CDS:1 [Funneliformis mosseae]